MAFSDLVRAAETHATALARRRLTQQGWVPTVTGFRGFGTTERLHVLGRALLADPRKKPAATGRGWRQFLTVELAHLPVTVRIGEKTVEAITNAEGYLDLIVTDHGLQPGWQPVQLSAPDGEWVTAEVLIVPADAPLGVICDIDDTVLVTWLPRALVAAWNSWVRHTATRRPVRGMSRFFQELLASHPDAPVIYLSTGAWNTFDSLARFLATHGFPKGPLLLTDWGPTATGLFRSGQEHKRVQLRNLFLEFPHTRWLLVGDNGQHDPLIYSEAAIAHRDHVAGVVLRELTPQEHLRSHGTASPLGGLYSLDEEVPQLTGADGFALLESYRRDPFWG